MKIAVFGHYDSRGGTSAVILPDNATIEHVAKAIEINDREMFSIEPGDEEMGSPSTVDFLHVSDIHGEPPTGVDLESIGAVLIAAEDAEFEIGNRVWFDIAKDTLKKPIQLEYVDVGPRDFMVDDDITWERKCKAALKFVPTGRVVGWDDDAFGFLILAKEVEA